MPSARTGEKTNLDRREYLELKSKGEKVKFRLASDEYYYEGKHFIKQDNGEWIVTLCPRINNEMECHYCEQYFAILKDLKKARADKDVVAEKELDKAQQKVKPAIAFYYPVLDRETGMAAILKVSLMVRLAFEELVSEGVDILKFDFIVKRTEIPGNYYSLSRVDSADTPKFTKEEGVELLKAKGQKISEIVGGKKGSMNYDVDKTTKEAEEVFKKGAEAVDTKKS